ncbi:MAG: NUDIX hydrolase [Bacteroidales bacterium]
MKYTYSYPRPAVTIDIMVFHRTTKQWEILLIERLNEPFKGMWALPGGFIEMEETLHQSAIRELREETGIALQQLQQFRTYGNPGRDPRGRTISVVYYAIIADATKKQVKAGDDAHLAQWSSIEDLPALAFDHATIMQEAMQHLPFLL